MKKQTHNRIWDSKLLYLIVALFASFFLWVYVTSVEKVEIEETFNNIPVVFYGADTIKDTKGLVLTESSETTVTIKLRGQRTVLSKLKDKKDEISAVIDVSGITEPVNNRTTYTISYPDGIDVSDVQVISRSPSVIEYYIDKESSKSIEVRGKFVGSVADGYIAEQLEINPQTIKISGPEKVIEQVDYAYVEINREDVDSTLEFSTAYQLIDVDGNVITDDSITPERDTVDVILPIKASKEVALAVDIIPGGGAASENVVVSIEPSAITIIGDADMLEGINKIVLGSIDLSEVDQSYEATYQIVLDNGVQNQTGTTEAKVTVEIKGLETRDIIINNFSCTNVPDGYDADIFTKSLTVKVRADSDTIDQIASTNIRAVADLSEYSGNEGDFTVPVKIYISDFADAGVVGSYSIYISISESSE